MRGYLQKKGEAGVLFGGGWRRRFFELKDGLLRYYTTEGGYFKGDIELVDAVIYSLPRNLIVIEGPKAKRRYELEASNPEEHSQWVTALQLATVPNPTPSATTPDVQNTAAAPLYPTLADCGLEERVPTTLTSARERDRQQNLAELFSLMQTLEFLERAFVRDAVPAEQYNTTCHALIGKYRLLLPALQDDVPSLDEFMHRYKLRTPAARHRLATGLTAVQEHGMSTPGVGSPAGGRRVQLVFEVGQQFITLMDALKLEQRAVDQLQPILADLHASLLQLGQQTLPGWAALVAWLGRLNGMKASEELSEGDARQLLFDAQTAYDAFHKSLGDR